MWLLRLILFWLYTMLFCVRLALLASSSLPNCKTYSLTNFMPIFADLLSWPNFIVFFGLCVLRQISELLTILKTYWNSLNGTFALWVVLFFTEDSSVWLLDGYWSRLAIPAGQKMQSADFRLPALIRHFWASSESGTSTMLRTNSRFRIPNAKVSKFSIGNSSVRSGMRAIVPESRVDSCLAQQRCRSLTFGRALFGLYHTARTVGQIRRPGAIRFQLNGVNIGG